MGSRASAEKGGDDYNGDTLTSQNQLVSKNVNLVSASVPHDIYNPDDPNDPKPLSIQQLKTMYPTETDAVHEKIKKDLEITKNIRSPQWIEEEINKSINIDYMYKRFFSRKALSRFSIQNDELKVRFLISDLESWKNVPRFARYLLFAVKPPCGFVHTSLQIGPWVIHWFDNSLVYMDQGSSQASIAIDMGTSISISDTKSIVAVLQTIKEWNATRNYSQFNNHCQSFVKDILRATNRENLGCFSGTIEEYFQRIDNGGIKDKIFKCPYDGTVTEFKTHKQLDAFIRKYMSKFAQKINYDNPEDYSGLLEEFQKRHPQDYALLKAYDRAWWLQTVKYARTKRTPKNDNHKADGNCPFGDPTQTGSIPVDYNNNTQ